MTLKKPLNELYFIFQNYNFLSLAFPETMVQNLKPNDTELDSVEGQKILAKNRLFVYL